VVDGGLIGYQGELAVDGAGYVAEWGVLRVADGGIGAASQSMPIVTAYATLGPEGLEYSLKETEAKAIFLDPQLVSTLFNPLKSSPVVKYVIYHGEPKTTDVEKLKTLHPQVTVISYDELVKTGKENPCPAVPPEPTDLACIMYTSGSTGQPKGVLLTHRNVVAASIFPRPYARLTSSFRGP
jgi:long-chain acyl-CoA synthetase